MAMSMTTNMDAANPNIQYKINTFLLDMMDLPNPLPIFQNPRTTNSLSPKCSTEFE
jgi:hypothetical protein